MLTNPGRILALLATLMTTVSLAACGGSPKFQDSHDISVAVSYIAGKATAEIYTITSPISVGNWAPTVNSLDDGFRKVGIFSNSLEYLGQRDGVHLAEAISRRNPPQSVIDFVLGKPVPPEFDWGVCRPCDFRDFAGWMEYSMFLVEDVRVIGRSANASDDSYVDLVVFPWSIGQASNSRPIAGGATWIGIMAGVDVSMTSTMGGWVTGSAVVEIPDFSVPALDVTFSDIAYTATGESHPSIEWSGLAIDDAGVFGGAGIQGRFYGPNHEEVGGVFQKDLISGAFGASR